LTGDITPVMLTRRANVTYLNHRVLQFDTNYTRKHLHSQVRMMKKRWSSRSGRHWNVRSSIIFSGDCVAYEPGKVNSCVLKLVHNKIILNNKWESASQDSPTPIRACVWWLHAQCSFLKLQSYTELLHIIKQTTKMF